MQNTSLGSGCRFLQEGKRWHRPCWFKTSTGTIRWEPGEYRYGELGYLVMDGSLGRIQCSRLIRPEITSADASVEVRLRAVLGHAYAVCLYDSKGNLAVRCELNATGWVGFRTGDEIIQSGKSLTYCYGIPAVDPEFLPANNTRESDEHALRFGAFDFTKGTLRFWLDDDPVTVEGALETGVSDIGRIEVQSQLNEGSTFSVYLPRPKKTEGEERKNERK